MVASEISKPVNILLRRYGFTVAIAVLALASASADEFHLRTGKIIRGAVVSQTATEYVLQTEVGTMKVNKSDVTRTVTVGTTPVEIEGDIAAKNGDLAKAQARYTQALNQSPAGSVAATRIRDKIDRLTSASRQAAVDVVVAQYNQALALLQSREYAAAEEALESLAAKVSPTDPLNNEIKKLQAQIHYGKGLAALDAVRLETAQQELESAIAADPTFYPAYLSLGEALLGNSATLTRGIELLEQGLEVGGDRITEQQRYSYQYRLAQKYFDQKDYAKAATMYAALIPARDKYPAYADALDLAVESYVKMGEENLSSDFRETIVNLNNALKLNPQNQKALFLLGRIYLDIGQVENAIVSMNRLVQLNDRYQGAHHYLGRAYFQANDNENALKHMSQEIGNEPGSYFTLVDRAEVYLEEGDNAAAQADIEAAKLIDPNHWRAYYLSGLLEYNQQDYEEARKSLMLALDRKKTAIPIHLLMGRVLRAQDQLPGARQWLEQVSDRLAAIENLNYTFKLHRADALTQLGQIALEENSPRQAENYLNPALQIAPDYAPALVTMADTKLLLAKDAFVSASKDQLHADAEQLYLQAIKKDPENAEYYSKLGRFYQLYRNDNEKAIQYYNLYADKGGKDSSVNVWLVEAGGQARPELQAVTVSATAGATTGTMITTATTAMTTGPLGTAVMTTSTMMTAPGTVLPVDAMMAETTGTIAVTTTTEVQTGVPPAPGAIPAAPAFPTPPPTMPVAPQ